MSGYPLDRLREIVLGAADLAGPERAAYLDQACAGDAVLRQEVERLLAITSESLSPIAPDLSAIAKNLIASAGPTIPRIGQNIGPYRLDQVLGSGGSGTVFAAEQAAPVRRRVAVKVLHRNRPLSADLARFRFEQQVLASLDHPNIAKVHDAGTTSAGVPYFVLELVEGEPISTFVRSADLDRDGRLELCRQACRAAEHAHAKGIIHRDLKPSNILVTRTTEGPLVKVIDFGIARMQDPGSGDALTLEGLHLGTPEYMSPEQASGEANSCDVQTDVHALGNILQEVLCGKGIYDVKTLSTPNQLRVVAAGRRVLATHDDKGRPLPTDLRRIIAAATEPDRERRYPTAAALAEDIERFRTHRPVMARDAGTWYQLRKAAERHPISTGMLAVLLLVIVGSLFTLLSLNAREREAVRLARAEADKSTNLVEYLTGIMMAASPDSLGKDVKLVEAFEKAAQRAEVDLAGDPATRSHFQYIIAKVEAALGNYEPALAALARSDSAWVRNPNRTEEDRLYRMLARASIHRNLGQFAPSDSLLQAILESAHGQPDLARLEAFTLIDLGDTHNTRGECAQAESTGAAAMAILQAVYGEHREAPYYDAVRIRSRGMAGVGKTVAARELLRRESAACERDFGPNDTSTLGILMDFAQSLDPGEHDEKVVLYRRILAATLQLLGPDHLGTAAAQNNLAVELMDYGLSGEARPYMADAARTWQAQYGRVHPYVATANNNLGFMCYLSGDMNDAEHYYREAIAIYREIDMTRFAHGQSNVHKNLAASLLRQGRLAEAETEARDALAVLGEEYAGSDFAAWDQYTLGSVLLAEGRTDDALDAFRAAQSVVDSLSVPQAYLQTLITNGTGCALLASDPATAWQMVAEVEPQLLKADGSATQRIHALQRTSALLAAHGEPERADRYAALAVALVQKPAAADEPQADGFGSGQ